MVSEAQGSGTVWSSKIGNLDFILLLFTLCLTMMMMKLVWWGSGFLRAVSRAKNNE